MADAARSRRFSRGPPCPVARQKIGGGAPGAVGAFLQQFKMRLHGPAERRQPRLLCPPIEQPPAQFLLETTDRIGERRLRDVATFGGTGEVPFPA